MHFSGVPSFVRLLFPSSQWALGRASFCMKYPGGLSNGYLYDPPAPQSLRTLRTFAPLGWPVSPTTILTSGTQENRTAVDFYLLYLSSSVLNPERPIISSLACTRTTPLAREKLLTQVLRNVSRMYSSPQNNLQFTSLWTPSTNVPTSLEFRLRVKKSWTPWRSLLLCDFRTCGSVSLVALRSTSEKFYNP